jgi:hypothetical protein
MREIHIHRADGSGVEPVVIRIDGQLPEILYSLPSPEFKEQAEALFAEQGAALAEAICSSCPGGTLDALLAALLTRRASLLRVRFPQEAGR